MTPQGRPTPRLYTILGVICVIAVFFGAYKVGQHSSVNVQSQSRTTLTTTNDAPVRTALDAHLAITVILHPIY